MCVLRSRLWLEKGRGGKGKGRGGKEMEGRGRDEMGRYETEMKGRRWNGTRKKREKKRKEG